MMVPHENRFQVLGLKLSILSKNSDSAFVGRPLGGNEEEFWKN